MEKNDSTAFGLGILAGVVGGIVLGVLYAPKPGEETRQKLKDAACDFAEKNAPKIRKAKQDAVEKLDLMRCKLEKKCDKICSKIKAHKMAKAKSKEEENYEFN